MIIRILKVLIGILLLPVAVATSLSFGAELGEVQNFGGAAGYFLKGVFIYLIMHLALYKPNYFYVLSHELAHALATFICGGRVSSFRVSSRGGGVLTTKSNFFIALFPYFFPTYTLFFWLVYFLSSLFRDVSAYTPHFLFLVGFSLTLHLVMTIQSLKVKQSDILKTGYLFSVSLIYVLNMLLVSLILSAVFKDFSFAVFFRSAVERSGSIYYSIYQYWFL
ncbi:MAG: M50 family metallopeptidase [Candidatus Omnitrophica bacterium]|nr:M50 family metallopeptidase [Candidatus Omnitrophota bacterium]